MAARTGPLRVAAAATIAVTVAACEDGTTGTAPAPEPERTPAAQPEPEPSLSSLQRPPAGRAAVALPRYRQGRFTAQVGNATARYGEHEQVWQIVVGDDPADRIVIARRGELAVGPHPLGEGAPAGGALTVSVRHDAEDLTTESGTVTILSVTEGGEIEGTFEVRARSRQLLGVASAAAHFRAARDPLMDAEVEHQEAIRQDLLRRRR